MLIEFPPPPSPPFRPSSAMSIHLADGPKSLTCGGNNRRTHGALQLELGWTLISLPAYSFFPQKAAVQASNFTESLLINRTREKLNETKLTDNRTMRLLKYVSNALGHLNFDPNLGCDSVNKIPPSSLPSSLPSSFPPNSSCKISIKNNQKWQIHGSSHMCPFQKSNSGANSRGNSRAYFG